MTTMEKTLISWNNIDPDVKDIATRGIVDSLRTITKSELIDFLSRFDLVTNKYHPKHSSSYVWQLCFKEKPMEYNKLSKDELIYFILELENYGQLKTPSFWSLSCFN